MSQYTSNKAITFQNDALSGFKFRALMFFQIPLLWYSGIKVKAFTREICRVHLPFTRRTKNPFRSVYFAAQCMAAELSTGLLVMAETFESGKKCSMLVTGMKANFIKKADANIIFSCQPGDQIIKAMAHSLEHNEPVKIVLLTQGVMADGTVVAEFEYEWSLKIKG